MQIYFQKQEQTANDMKKMLDKEELRKLNRVRRYEEMMESQQAEPDVRMQDVILKMASEEAKI